MLLRIFLERRAPGLQLPGDPCAAGAGLSVSASLSCQCRWLPRHGRSKQPRPGERLPARRAQAVL